MAKFTKQHYVEIADLLAKNLIQSKDNSPNSYLTVRAIQDDFVRMFESDTPRFDVDKFNQYIEKKVKEYKNYI